MKTVHSVSFLWELNSDILGRHLQIIFKR